MFYIVVGHVPGREKCRRPSLTASQTFQIGVLLNRLMLQPPNRTPKCPTAMRFYIFPEKHSGTWHLSSTLQATLQFTASLHHPSFLAVMSYLCRAGFLGGGCDKKYYKYQCGMRHNVGGAVSNLIPTFKRLCNAQKDTHSLNK